MGDFQEYGHFPDNFYSIPDLEKKDIYRIDVVMRLDSKLQ